MFRFLVNLGRIQVAKAKWKAPKYRGLKEEIRDHESRSTIWNEKHEPMMPVFMTSFKPVTIKGEQGRAYTVELGKAKYESPVAIHLNLKSSPENPVRTQLGELKLAFEGSTITMLPQGKKYSRKEGYWFEADTGVKWPNYLIRMVEDLASRTGFTELRIPSPETLYWYKEPAYSNPKTRGKIQARMRVFYEKIAAAEGYKLNESKDFFVKKIS